MKRTCSHFVNDTSNRLEKEHSYEIADDKSQRGNRNTAKKKKTLAQSDGNRNDKVEIDKELDGLAHSVMKQIVCGEKFK